MAVRRIRFGAIASAALLALVIGTTPAQAYSFERDRVRPDTWWNGAALCAWKSYPSPGLGCFEEDGDYIQVGDTASDGRRVGVQWRTGYGRSGICVSKHGQDTIIKSGTLVGNYSCNKNMKEGHKIRIRVGACNGSKVNCGRLKNWGTWSAWSRWMTT